jgi:general secretion pathway protein G
MKKSAFLRTRAFTLIELLLVMVILAVLAALVLPKFTGRTEDANKTAAQTQISSLFSTALDLYEADNGSFPTTAQGLAALRAKPTSSPEPKHWKGPYLKSDVPKDPWGNEYTYRSPGQKNPSGYDLVCAGPDGREGTEDDITNWTTQR